MKTVKFIKGPGYLYDLFSLFVLYFNQETFLAEQVNQNKAMEDTEHFNSILREMKTIPEELRIFFQLRDNKKCFFTTSYFQQKIDEILSGLNVEAIQSSLTNYKKVIADVVDFYFEIPASEANYDDPLFIWTVGKLIRDSEYDAVLKNCLYQFFFDPIPVLQTLSNELARKEVLLSKMYMEKDGIITKVQNNLDLEKLEKNNLTLNKNCVDLTSFNKIIISICIAQKNCIGSFFHEDTALILLGDDYENFLNYINTKVMTPELAQFGIALAEPNRIQILDLVREKGELSVAEIKTELNFSHTNAYYHITLLQKSNLLSARNQGRTVLYRLNYDFFSDVGILLNKYKTPGGEKQ